MRRQLTLALLVILAAGLLAACGGSSADGLSADSANDQPATSGRHGEDAHAGEDGGMEMDHDDAPDPVAPGAREVEVMAHSYEFGPPDIQARAGEDLAVVLSADDIEHDFVVDELGTHISADAGETTRGGLRIDEPGTYTYYCSVAGHREAGMEGTLTVT